MWLFAVGFFVHLIFFFSVFDIYFRTPLIHGMTPQSHSLPPAARRVVLLVADGLRADVFFDNSNNTTRAPYLRSIIENNGTWGVSHTRVPTESRPGHVAIIAGLYEDPSAIAKGWKENPVEFDSVFNESRHTWCWGSPDILPMFAAGAERGHIETFMYKAEEEDFASSDASKLDKWVFQNVESFFMKASREKTVQDVLHEDRIVFFLHLLGLDTNGHAHKPHSKEYLKNIETVDAGIQKTVEIFENFFGDHQTAYIFTSDHGMTDWGSHGAGDPSETETPFIAWGAGVAMPKDPSEFKEKMMYDARVERWGLTHVRRHDLHQADVAPLMASILGIPIPVNNVGKLHIEYLATSDEYKSEALFANARQMLAQYQQKRTQKEEETLPIFYWPYTILTPDKELEFLAAIRNYLQTAQFDAANSESQRLISVTQQGMDYYHNYDRLVLSVHIALGFLGWIFLIVCHLLKDHSAVLRMAGGTIEGRRVWRSSFLMALVLVVWGITNLTRLLGQHHPWQHYLYLMTPVGLWALVHQSCAPLRVAWLLLCSFNMVWEVAIRILFIFVGIEILVMAFFLRPMLSVGLLCVGLWPVIMYTMQGTVERSMRLVWIGSCVLLASFTYMPVVGREAYYPMVEIAGLVAFMLGCIGIYWCGGEGGGHRHIPGVMYLQGLMVVCTVYLVHSTAFSLSRKEGLPFINQLAAWTLLVLSLLLPLLGSHNMMGRLLSVSTSLFCPFLLLSIRHEGFFYIALTIAMYLWLILEFYLAENNVQIAMLKFATWCNEALIGKERVLEWSDVRRAYFFLFFIVLAFFGTGNIASINSFDPAFVYCFVTVFSPFLMGSLLLCKIIIPFLLVTCFFHAICSLIKVPTRALFYVFLVMSDFMAVHFFFLIKTEGSWLDIGTSLSHYIISMATTLFLILLLFIAKFLTTFHIGKASTEGECVLPRVSVGRPHRD
ncbi:GPI ethanolamine phosphate transferase 1-like isoform X1 [Portunus trituberculatus]|uniref:GPI ethanolamine phosphate transferase 1-like isoform X1 n=1 Tax=Portunus trituberculatus TaxID=210409 RepID=UPI001E1CDA84|nr:GPI ethanolamine phosphate transferase 1-like isoform X1 [Portunus trituberculatus]